MRPATQVTNKLGSNDKGKKKDSSTLFELSMPSISDSGALLQHLKSANEVGTWPLSGRWQSLFPCKDWAFTSVWTEFAARTL